jgi:hypothetical protein
MHNKPAMTPTAVRARYEKYNDWVVEMRAATPAGKKLYYDNTTTALRRMRDKLLP